MSVVVSVTERDRAQARLTLQAMHHHPENRLELLATALATARAEGVRAALQQRMQQVPHVDPNVRDLLGRAAEAAAAWVEDKATDLEVRGMSKVFGADMRASCVELCRRIRGLA